ncbi:LytR/AlgR family response regulator transcription factor [Alkalilimnicola sp. S0819]|uniref:LytR/AlgR family response regulator transcription factor n=1 Tax=Alkalilimnicola sp. S0819 TaxID=2613922 RepID=UPI001262486D|nr:LytTR family DNA-binding domain-containing protein [Alkalilimnicola sp. S0819]KAB7622700.1 response regulator transcription factor [Alkalilimnicola sp. S0819]MPQ17338.1 response regulator [Alkalilimnicola sp. S0819]
MRLMIVDDEAPARTRLRKLIEELGAQYRVVAEAGTGRQALEQAAEHAPELVLMDIRMPGMDGLEAAVRLAQSAQPPALIFITASTDHALQAFEANAVDYLVKPVRRARLEEALQKARRLNRAQLQALKQPEPPTEEAEALLVRRRDGMELLPLHQVRYLQAEHKYVTVHHAGGEELIEQSLKQLEEQHPRRLLRIHRNCLVNKAWLAGMERGDGGPWAVLRDGGERLEISRRHVAGVREFLRRLGVE